MSLFFQYIEGCFADEQYHEIRQAMKEFQQGSKPFPPCIYRELGFGIRGSFRQIRNDKLFPIRFLSLFGLNEQRLSGLPVMGRSYYHPERLYQRWELCCRDEAVRQEAEEAGVMFDMQNKAILLTRGWVWIGDTFVQDFFEIEAHYDEKLLFPDPNNELKPIFNEYRQGGQNG